MKKKYRIWTDGVFFLIERDFKHNTYGTTHWETINGGKVFLNVESLLDWANKNGIVRNEIESRLVNPKGMYIGYIDKKSERKDKLKKLNFL